MCRLFIGADSKLWESHTRSLRIDGVATSIRLEQFFWNTLEEIAYRDDMTVISLITKLYFESIDEGHDLGNFTSFLRVCCGRYFSLIAMDELSLSLHESVAETSASTILQNEKSHFQRVKLNMMKVTNQN